MPGTNTVSADDEKEWDEEADRPLPFRYSMTSWGADYTVDGLVNRMLKKDIFVPPFQRGYVWSFYQASRFIESLLLGLPVPGIFLSKEYETQKLLVVDGQQRLKTLQYFYEGIFEPGNKVFALKGVQDEFEGLTIKTLKEEDRRKLNDSIIHATIVKQDSPEEDNSSVYYLFERLNTGGTNLLPQEIRACIFQGEFNDLLKELNENTTWRMLYGEINKRMKDVELILRFFALLYNGRAYESPMKVFLNKFMGKNRHLKHIAKEEFTRQFANTVETAANGIGPNVFKLERVITASLFDAIMVGLACRLENGTITNYGKLNERYNSLLQNKEFRDAIIVATANEKNVFQRTSLAIEAFADVP